jgi:hypothetical protein
MHTANENNPYNNISSYSVGMNSFFTKYHLYYCESIIIIIHSRSTYYSEMHTLYSAVMPSLDDALQLCC